MRFDLSDDEWVLLEPLMPKSRKSARVDDRKIMNAISYVLYRAIFVHNSCSLTRRSTLLVTSVF
jgi:transposase